MDVGSLVRGHYGAGDLESRILAALEGAGVDVNPLRVEDLAPIDSLHAGSWPATEFLLDQLDLGPDTRLLDIGSGVGGPARAAAGRGGEVVGIDLTPEYVELAQALSARVGLADRVRFEVASGDDLPYEDGSFDRAMLVHVGMNVPDKGRLFAETRRVMRPDGVFGLFEQMRANDGPLPYPLPWADDERSSFVATPEDYEKHLTEAGFAVERVLDRTADVAIPPGRPMGTGLGPHLVFGAGFAEKLENNVTATREGLLRAVLIVAHAR
jgi:SAM-dependent methyltransferase